jgi:mevalonate kinase
MVGRLRGLFNDTSEQNEAAGQGMLTISYLIGHIILKNLISGQFGLIVHIESHDLPIGAGLGSSAAFSVASSAACLHLSHQFQPIVSFQDASLSKEGTKSTLCLAANALHLINSWAFIAETLIHGTPSGLDNTTSTLGGMLKFTKSLTDSVNVYHPLTDVPSLRILLTNTKVPRSTKELVAGVRRLHTSFPTVVTPIFESIRQISEVFLQLIR